MPNNNKKYTHTHTTKRKKLLLFHIAKKKRVNVSILLVSKLKVGKNVNAVNLNKQSKLCKLRKLQHCTQRNFKVKKQQFLVSFSYKKKRKI